MRRRHLLGWGGAAAVTALLATAGAISIRPGLLQGRLTPAGEDLINAVGRAMLQGSIPGGLPEQRELAGLRRRFEELVQALPSHVQGEIEELLAALLHPIGCRMLTDVALDWTTASSAQVQSVLSDMQRSKLKLRRQAYLALHDLIGGAYFADPQTWALLGYPGPVAV